MKAAVALPNIELHAWSWICVVLEKKAFWRSVAKVYLNGRHVGDHTLPYPPPSGMSKTGAGNHHNLSPMMMIYIKSIYSLINLIKIVEYSVIYLIYIFTFKCVVPMMIHLTRCVQRPERLCWHFFELLDGILKFC